MELFKLANFPAIRIERNQGAHWLQIDNESALIERCELENMANGANLLLHIIKQYLLDLDCLTVIELDNNLTTKEK